MSRRADKSEPQASLSLSRVIQTLRRLDESSPECKHVQPRFTVRKANYHEIARMVKAGAAVLITRAVLRYLLSELDEMPGAHYSTAIVVRLHEEERNEINERAKAENLSAQRFIRKQLGLPETSTKEEACQRAQPNEPEPPSEATDNP